MAEKIFTPTTIHSPYLDMDFEMLTYQTDDGKTIISHNSLEDIINNELPMEYETRHDTKLLYVSDAHNVAQCIFVDKMNRRIQGIGETTFATLKTEVARDNPALMATQRAFDRAAIRYLRLPGKVYSSLEGVDEEAPRNIQEDTSAPQAPKSEEQASSIQSPKSRLEELGNITFGMGAYIDKPCTLAELYKNDYQSFVWLLEKYKGTSRSGKKVKEQAMEYKTLMESLENKNETAPSKLQSASNKPQAAKTNENTNADATKLGNEKCNVGQHRAAPITLAELWRRDKEYFIWLCERYQATTESSKAVQKNAIAYRKLMES